MQSEWRDDQPIYRQLRDKVTSLIMNGTYAEGEAVPSVRQVSSDLGINHLTVSKAYQELVDEGLLVKKRGLGMFVIEGAKTTILEREKERFLAVELPEFFTRLEQLNISLNDIIPLLEKHQKEQQ